jgi:Tol biopolymer transport system component
VLLDLETDSVRVLIPGGLDAKYIETGHLLYADLSGGLWAVPFDAGRGETLGGAVPVLDGLSILQDMRARYSVSRNGTLVYAVGGGGAGTFGQRLLVVDLEGNEEPTPLDPRLFLGAQWSPDGETVAYFGTEASQFVVAPNIYTYNLALRTAPRRLTFEGNNQVPVWSPDGSRIAFASNRDGTDGFDLFVKNVDDDFPPQMIVTLSGPQFPTQWPSDDVVLFENGLSPSALWMIDLSSDSVVASPYLESEGDLDDFMVSPDGNLAAYTSNESGRDEVYVRSFPDARQPEIVSQGGGVFPFWSPDSNTIYYWTLGPNTSPKSLIATRIERGPPFVVTSRDTLFTGTYRNFDSSLHPDGDRLVIPQDVLQPGAGGAAGDGSEPERFILVTNWFEELRQRMGN